MLAMLELRISRHSGGVLEDELAYIRKRISEEEAERKREQDRIAEEAARIAREDAELERLKARRKSIKEYRESQEELDRLTDEIERLQAELAMLYRRELENRQQEEMAMVCLIILMNE